MSKSMIIRVPVMVTPNGEWHALGCHGDTPDQIRKDMRALADDLHIPSYDIQYIEAVVPLPTRERLHA